MFSAIVAVDAVNGIGKDGRIPWRVKADLQEFKRITNGNVIIMGRKTYQSIGWALPNRVNIIISKTIPKLESKDNAEVLIFADLQECVKHCYKQYLPNKKCFVIGGGKIYKWFYQQGLIYEEYITVLPDANYECDTYFTNATHYTYDRQTLIKKFDVQLTEPNAELYYNTYQNQYELAMLNVMKTIINSGNQRLDRTGVGTYSIFGQRLEFPLHDNTFPLMTTRKLPLRWIFEELMLYIRGQTNSKILEEKGIDIWKANTTTEFLNKAGIHDLPEGDMGESYGFLFRHFGAEYINCNADYTNKGFDQLTYVINELKTNKASRRAIISLWKPGSKAALPPCLEQYIFDVSSDNELSCMMVQRSSDFFIAGGWNVATGALLTILIAAACSLRPHKLIWCIANVHIYNNLIDQTKEQIQRQPYLYPKLYLNRIKDNINEYQWEDITLTGYIAHPAIKGVMNA